MSVKSNSIEDFVEAYNNNDSNECLIKVVDLFDFTHTFARVLSALKYGHPAEYIALHFRQELLQGMISVVSKLTLIHPNNGNS